MKPRTTRKRTVPMQLIEEAQELRLADRTLTNTDIIDKFKEFNWPKPADAKTKAERDKSTGTQ